MIMDSEEKGERKWEVEDFVGRGVWAGQVDGGDGL